MLLYRSSQAKTLAYLLRLKIRIGGSLPHNNRSGIRREAYHRRIPVRRLVPGDIIQCHCKRLTLANCAHMHARHRLEHTAFVHHITLISGNDARRNASRAQVHAAAPCDGAHVVKVIARLLLQALVRDAFCPRFGNLRRRTIFVENLDHLVAEYNAHRSVRRCRTRAVNRPRYPPERADNCRRYTQKRTQNHCHAATAAAGIIFATFCQRRKRRKKFRLHCYLARFLAAEKVINAA